MGGRVDGQIKFLPGLYNPTVLTGNLSLNGYLQGSCRKSVTKSSLFVPFRGVWCGGLEGEHISPLRDNLELYLVPQEHVICTQAVSRRGHRELTEVVLPCLMEHRGWMDE